LKTFQLQFITDKAKARWFQILQELETKKTCSTVSLTELTNSTARTIVTDFNYLREYFKEIAHFISSKQGYSIEIEDSEIYLEKKRAIIQDEALFIILERMFFNELKSIYEWADYFHISESTMIKNMKKLSDQLSPFGLSLELNPVNLTGSETDIRNFYFSFYYESDITPHTIFPTVAAQEAVFKIASSINNTITKIVPFGYLSYLLYISIERIICGFSVKIDDSLKSIVLRDPEFHKILIAYNIINEYFQIELSIDEGIFLYLSILCRRPFNDLTHEKYFCKRYNNWPEITALTKSYLETVSINDSNEYLSLILLESFFTSSKLRSLLSNSGNKNIQDTNDYAKKHFLHSYNKNMSFLKKSKLFYRLFNVSIIDDICANLTLFTETIIEKYNSKPRNIAFMLEGNEYINQYTEAWIRKYLGEFQNVYFLGPSELCNSYLNKNNIDLLVTNYTEHLNHSFINLDYILLKEFPDASDWANLLKKISPQLLNNFILENKY
jgi:hypothetical protein